MLILRQNGIHKTFLMQLSRVIETGMNWYFLQWYILGHTVEPIKLIYECMGCDTLGVGALTWDYVHWF